MLRRHIKHNALAAMLVLRARDEESEFTGCVSTGFRSTSFVTQLIMQLGVDRIPHQLSQRAPSLLPFGPPALAVWCAFVVAVQEPLSALSALPTELMLKVVKIPIMLCINSFLNCGLTADISQDASQKHSHKIRIIQNHSTRNSSFDANLGGWSQSDIAPGNDPRSLSSGIKRGAAPLQAVLSYKTQLALPIPSELVGLGNTQGGEIEGKLGHLRWQA